MMLKTARSWPDRDDAPNPRAARLIPWMFVAGFAVVAAVNGVMIAFALETFSGVTTDQAYEEGLAYNKTLAAAAAQEKLGWKVGIDLAAPTHERARLSVTLADRNGAPIHGAVIEAHFVRPTSEGFDSQAQLSETGNGRYEAETSLALPGQWDVVVTASYDGASYQKTERVFIPQ